MTALTIEQVNTLNPDEAIRLVGSDDENNVWQRRGDGFFINADGQGVLPGAAFVGYAEAGRLVKYNQDDVVPGQLRTQYAGRDRDGGYQYLVLAESAQAGQVYVARFNKWVFMDLIEVNQEQTKPWSLVMGGDRPEWVVKSYGMLRALLRSGNFNLGAETRAALPPQIVESLHGVADKIDNELLDEFLGAISMPRPGLLAEVTVMLGGKVMMVPQGLPAGFTAKEVEVPWVREFTYASLGKGDRCEQPDMTGRSFADLVVAHSPEGAFDVVTECSCSHDEKPAAQNRRRGK